MFLRNSVALITGGAQGLGKGFARAILQAGGKVSLLDVKEDVGHKTVEEFSSDFGPDSTIFLKCDVRSQQEVEAAFQQTFQRFGKLDIVVNNAGTATFDTNWKRTIDINLIGVMHCCFAAADYLTRTKQGGHIINISSAAGIVKTRYDPAYAASKHGVVGLSRCLSEMWEQDRIRVNCICPAYADTELVRRAQKLNVPDFNASVDAVGVMSVDDVVQAFTNLLQEPNSTGGVLLVYKFVTKYQFTPKTMNNASKL